MNRNDMPFLGVYDNVQGTALIVPYISALGMGLCF